MGRFEMPPGIKHPKLYDRDWLETQLYCHCRTRTEIAAEIGCNPNTISTRAKAMGIAVPNWYLDRMREKNAKLYEPYWLREQYEAGRSTNSIAKEVGCVAKTVRIAARKMLPADFITKPRTVKKMQKRGPTAKGEGKTRDPRFVILPTSPLADHPLFKEFVKK